MSIDANKQVEKLSRKAEVTRNAHSILHRRFKRYSSWLHFFILIGSSIIAILTFAGYETFLPLFPHWTDAGYRLGVGIFASVIFILTVVEEYLKLASRVSAHEHAIKELTTFIRNADVVRNKDQIGDKDITDLVAQYTNINSSIPSIPDEVFYKAKQGLKRKIEISKMLDSNPFMSIRMYKWYKTLGQMVEVRGQSNKLQDELSAKNQHTTGTGETSMSKDEDN